MLPKTDKEGWSNIGGPGVTRSTPKAMGGVLGGFGSFMPPRIVLPSSLSTPFKKGLSPTSYPPT